SATQGSRFCSYAEAPPSWVCGAAKAAKVDHVFSDTRRQCVNLVFGHDQPRSIRALFRVINRYVGNLPPMPGVFPDYPAPAVRNVGNERELVDALGNAAIAKDPWAASNQHPQTSSPHWPGWLKPETALAGSPLCR